MQLTALQAYVKPKREAKGHFSNVHQIRVGNDDITEKNAALDIVTKSLAQYAEKAYAVNTNEGEEEDPELQSIATPSALPPSNIKVDLMDAEFILDENENLFFSHLSNVLVQVVHAKRERNQELKRMEEAKLIEAASVVGNELKRLLRMAANRGVSVATSFSHFDSQGLGYADVHNLVEGLSRLGIGISTPAADILMSMIGTASSLHFRARDLVMFAELEQDDIESDGEESSNQLKVDNASAPGEYFDPLSYYNGSPQQTLDAPPRRSRRKRKRKKGGDLKSGSDDANDAASSKHVAPLDLPYTVDAEAARKTNNGEPLPRWARSKTKKAYGELKKAEGRYLKKQALSVDGDGNDDDDSISSGSDTDGEGPDNKKSVALGLSDHDEGGGGDDADGEESQQDEQEMQSSVAGSKKSFSLASLSQSATASLDSTEPSLLLHPAGENSYEDDPNIDLNDKDSLFHAHSSIVMSYRVVKAADRPKANRRGGATDLQQRVAFSNANEILQRLEPLKETPFQLIVTPDIFMTLDTLEEALAPLLDQHPLSSILLVGLPGLPNTLWQKGTVLNNETHSLCLSDLLHHLESNGDFTSSGGHPTFFLGFGLGAACLTYFATFHFNEDRHRQLKRVTKSFILCNSFSRITQELKRTIQGVRRVFKKDDYQERMQVLMSILFSDQYLQETGRDAAMEEFWRTRSRISLKDDERASNNRKNSHICAGNGKEGVTSMLHGMQSNIDVTSSFDMISAPLLLIQSSKDNFVSPTNIEVFEQTEEEFLVVQSPRELLDAETSAGASSSSSSSAANEKKVINVQWLHCGHELLQERKNAVTGLVMKLIMSAHEERETVEEVSMSNLDNLNSSQGADQLAGEEEGKAQNLSDFFDILNVTDADPADATDLADNDLNFESSTLQSAPIGESTASSTGDSIIELKSSLETPGGAPASETSTTTSAAERQKKKRERRAREAQVRKQRDEERKLRKIRDEQAQELKKIRAAEQAKTEENKSLEERHAMHREDLRSSLAEEYFRECEEWEANAELARAKAAELQAAREEDEMAELEAEAARKRAKKHEARRARIADLRRKYLDEELRMDGDKDGAFKRNINELDAHQAAPYCQRLLADLFQCRRRMIDAMKRAKLALDKVKVFQEEYDATEREVRGLRRTQRLATTNSTFQAIKPSKRELEELKNKLDDKQNALSEIKSLLSGRKDLLDISNRSVQGLLVVLEQKEEETKDMIKTLKIRENKMKSNLAVFRVTKDNYSNERDEIDKILAQSEQRMKVVTIELKKVSRHTGKFVDTDVWQKGVMQRMLSVDIREHLEREQSTLARVLDEFKRTLVDVKGGIYKCDRDIKQVMGEIEEVRAIHKFNLCDLRSNKILAREAFAPS